MKICFPFTPKSNLKLKPGYFWTIRISEDLYAAGVVLAIPSKDANDTRTFLAGLLDWVGTSKPTQVELEKSNIRLVDQGEAHIKTITMMGEQIEGEINLEKCKVGIRLEVDSSVYSKYSYILNGFKAIAKATVADHNYLHTRTTWGYNVINIKASSLLE